MKIRPIVYAPLLGISVTAFVVGLAGCSHRATEVTQADLETTNAPPGVVGPGLRFDARQGGKMRIEGTSSIHDWQVEGGLIGGFLEVTGPFPEEPGQVVAAGKLQVKGQAFIPVRSLRSIEKNGKLYSDKMDDIMYEKLKSPEQPKIIYYLGDLVLKEAARSKEAAYVYDSTGELVVAGVTNKLAMPISITPLGDNKLKITGSTSVKMTSFGITPPSPSFLPIKTGDEVKLLFEWMVGRKPASAAAEKQP
jgi:hypothetical protein